MRRPLLVAAAFSMLTSLSTISWALPPIRAQVGADCGKVLVGLNGVTYGAWVDSPNGAPGSGLHYHFYQGGREVVVVPPQPNNQYPSFSMFPGSYRLRITSLDDRYSSDTFSVNVPRCWLFWSPFDTYYATFPH